MADESKRYISVAKFKSFWNKFPWQKARKSMGLGDSLGVLQPEYGGTGGGSLSEFESTLKGRGPVTAIYRLSFGQVTFDGSTKYTYCKNVETLQAQPFCEPVYLDSGYGFKISPGCYFPTVELTIRIDTAVTYASGSTQSCLLEFVKSYTNDTLMNFIPSTSQSFGAAMSITDIASQTTIRNMLNKVGNQQTTMFNTSTLLTLPEKSLADKDIVHPQISGRYLRSGAATITVDFYLSAVY